MMCTFSTLMGQGQHCTLQDISKSISVKQPPIIIYEAKEIVTLDDSCRVATAVAVDGSRIVAVGSLNQVIHKIGKHPYVIDKQFKEKVVVPGFIAQHDHPLLAALTMMSKIISIEDWVFPDSIVKAVNSQAAYRNKLEEAVRGLSNQSSTFVTWGYHPAFHGAMGLGYLDSVSTSHPIVIWHRSAHEFYLNTAALKSYNINSDFVSKLPIGAQQQINLADGHFWEQGMFAVIPMLINALASPQKVYTGLNFIVKYLHSNGVTLACEPGGLYSRELQDAENMVLSPCSSPFRFYFIPDGKSIVASHPDSTVIAATDSTLLWCQGMTTMLPKKIKLFSDGAIFSLAMQLTQPYIGPYQGAWIMDSLFFARAFRLYWNAGYQIHIHVNGDKGLDYVLKNVSDNMKSFPRVDHRTVIVHFAVSRADQVAQIKSLGAIVSANPYYVHALADKYCEVGLGPDRANEMVRVGDLERAGISYSFHSDMPMAPAQPLFLMDCGVNRTTVSGRVAGADQKASQVKALRAITIDAAYSLGLENEVGSITSGKLANFTILEKNPTTCIPAEIRSIKVWGTIQEGRVLPAVNTTSPGLAYGPIPNESTLHVLDLLSKDDGEGDVCTVNYYLSIAYGSLLRNNK